MSWPAPQVEKMSPELVAPLSPTRLPSLAPPVSGQALPTAPGGLEGSSASSKAATGQVWPLEGPRTAMAGRLHPAPLRQGPVPEAAGREARALPSPACPLRVWSWRGVHASRGPLVAPVPLTTLGAGRGGPRADGESLSTDLGKDSGGQALHGPEVGPPSGICPRGLPGFHGPPYLCPGVQERTLSQPFRAGLCLPVPQHPHL